MVEDWRRRRRALDPIRVRAAGAQLVVVTGPPAAGKSSWVEQHAQRGDVRIDLDLLAVALGVDVEPTAYPAHIRHVALDARDAAIRRATQLRERVTVWLIHSVPTPEQLAEYAAAGAELVVVDPGRDVVLDRCASLRTPAALAAAVAWYEQHDHSGQATTVNASRVW